MLVSEPFAYRTGVDRGGTRAPADRPRRPGLPRGRRLLRTTPRTSGIVMMSRATYLRNLERPRPLGLRAHPRAGGRSGPRRGAPPQDDRPERVLSIQSTRSLKRLSLEIFDRTFLITGVLRLLAGLVAFIGVLSSLMALQLERSRELGVLRANGLTPGQVWQLVTSQTGLMGLAAGLLSIPVGLALAAIMIYVSTAAPSAGRSAWRSRRTCSSRRCSWPWPRPSWPASTRRARWRGRPGFGVAGGVGWKVLLNTGLSASRHPQPG